MKTGINVLLLIIRNLNCCTNRILNTEDLERFNRIAVRREMRMIEMKKEINAMSERLGEPPRYSLESMFPYQEQTPDHTKYNKCVICHQF